MKMIRQQAEKIKNKNYNIISLGYNCYPRTLLTRYGLKKTREQGELTMPFDLAVFATKEITSNLRYDFKYFFDDLEYSKEQKIWTRGKDKIQFRHDTWFGEFSRNELIDKYKKRIENFYSVVNDPNPLLILQLLGDDEDADNVYLQLRRLRQQTKFVFCVIDPNRLTKNLDKRIMVFDETAPEGYFENWWKKSCYSQKSAAGYEQKIIDFCIDSLNNHLSA